MHFAGLGAGLFIFVSLFHPNVKRVGTTVFLSLQRGNQPRAVQFLQFVRGRTGIEAPGVDSQASLVWVTGRDRQRGSGSGWGLPGEPAAFVCSPVGVFCTHLSC